MMNQIKESFEAVKIFWGVLLVVGAFTETSHASIDISDVHGLSSANLSSTFDAGHTSALDWVQVFDAGGTGNLGNISGLSMYLENTSASAGNITISIATYNPISQTYGTATALGTISVPSSTKQVDSITLSDTTYKLVGSTDYALEFQGTGSTDIPFTTENALPTVTSSVTPNASLLGFNVLPNAPYSGYQMGFEVDFTPIPEPATYITGAMMLLPLGAALLRKLRKGQSA